MSAAFNPYAHLKRAANGSLTSLRELTVQGSNAGLEHLDIVALTEGLLFGRMAFALSGESEDAAVLLNFLAAARQSFPNDEMLVEQWGAEAIAIITQLADSGDELAGAVLPGIMEEMSKGTILLAKEVSELMEEEPA